MSPEQELQMGELLLQMAKLLDDQSNRLTALEKSLATLRKEVHGGFRVIEGDKK